MLSSLIDKITINEEAATRQHEENSDYTKKITALWGSITDETFVRHSEFVNNVG